MKSHPSIKTGILILHLFLLLITVSVKAQLVKSFTPRFQVTQKGGIVYLANTSVGCSANPTSAGGTCQTGTAEVPPNGNYVDNNFSSAYIDIDGNSSTFMSSSDSLNLPNCSSITWAGLFWSASGSNPTNNTKIKIKVNSGAYQSITADANFSNSTGYNSYHNFKNITSIVKAAGTKARFTVADIPFATLGQSNLWGGWTIVVVYGNQLVGMKQLTVFDGLVSVSGSNTATVPITGFLTPLTGPVNIELGAVTFDGDRGNGYTGDQLLFNGVGSNYVNVTDGLNPVNDVFNSTIAYNGVLTPHRIPNLNNTAGLDADIFIPNNSAKNFIGNSASSANLKLTTGGETYLTQVITTAIDVYEPDLNITKTVKDRFGNNMYLGTINPGDTLEYTITVKNFGSDTSINTFITDSIQKNAVFVPGSMKITYGPNTGVKTNASSDDQADYIAATNKIIVRVGTGANGTAGGKVGNSTTGADSTVIKFKVTAETDCFILRCDSIINNTAIGTGTGKISGNILSASSNPFEFDASGCPISGATQTNIYIHNLNCVEPADTSITICSSSTQTFAQLYKRPGYVFYNSAFSSVTSPSTTGTYYALRTSYAGCVDTVVITLTITNPNAGTDKTGICAGTNVLLTGTNPATGTWSAMAGNPSGAVLGATTSGNATVNFNTTASGVYYYIYSLIGGCTDTMSITVSPLPTVAAITGATNVCIGSTITLLETTTNGIWSSRNANIATVNASGIVTPIAVGTATITYTVTNANGCKDSVTSAITVSDCAVVAPPQPCNMTAVINVNQLAQCVTNNQYVFTSNITGGTLPFTYDWDLNDGTHATTKDVTKVYAASGEHDVTLIVKDSKGCEAHASTVQIYIGAKPTASFNIVNNSGSGSSTTFISTSTISGGWLNYYWDLGNGTTSTLVNPEVTYAPGTYTVKLIATGNFGCSDTITKVIIITNNSLCVLPTANFTINNANQCLAGNGFQFTNSSTGSSLTYVWNFGDASATAATTNSSHTYSSASTYTVSLTATNSCGSNMVTKTVTVETAPPSPASISGATSVNVGASITLASATSSGVWSSSNTAIATVNASTGLVTGIAVGTATITYTVSNACGNANTSKLVTVSTTCVAPVANFTINNASQCLSGNSFTFTNSSTGTTPTYTWAYGDGSAMSTLIDGYHSYTSASNYTVTLAASNACGISNITKMVMVNAVPSPLAAISGNTSVITGSTTSLNNAIPNGVWSSSNTTIATVNASTGLVTGVAAGAATITYTVSNACGNASVNTVISVANPIVPCNLSASFTVNNTKQCITDNQFIFTNSTTGGTAPYTYLWDLNDGTNASTKDVTKVYGAYGEHDVTLKVTDANGCVSHSSAQQIYIGAKPVASFNILPNTVNGQSQTFISSSTIALGTMNYLWDLGNGTTSTLINPSVTYAPGTYTVKLTVSGWGTCKDQATQTFTQSVYTSLNVYPNPVMDAILVTFRSASATQTTIKILDLQGRVLLVQTVTPISTGANVVTTIDTRSIQTGSYILYISDVQNGILATKQILKQ